MKQNKIKSRRRLERGCNFPHAMLSGKYPSIRVYPYRYLFNI